ncbi:MAG: lipid-A-disaccharide synthase [Denitrovibrio sp.]|nr:MAG: lipid-A-disaccharide synthase [Denitrovibrio sp.]
MKELKLFIMAAEKSGDSHAGELVSALSEKYNLTLTGTGGPDLLRLGQKQLYDVNDLSVIGVDEAIRKLRFLFKVRDRLLEELNENRPDAVVLVDYPGFNLRFAKEVKKLGIPVIFFISPTFWAWNYKRVYKLRDYCDLVICIYPFEEDILLKEGVNAKYVGNPLKTQIKFKCESKEDFLEKGNFDKSSKIIGMLPGSRKREIESLLPVMINAAIALPEFEFVVGAADGVDEEYIKDKIKGTKIRFATNLTHDIMKYSDILWVCSGTATLESAIVGTPLILLYKTGFLTYFLGKIFYRLKYIGMPNIIMNKAVIPELVQSDATPFNLVKFTEKILSNIDTVKADLVKVGEYFPDVDAAEAAAGEIYSFMEKIGTENSTILYRSKSIKL